MKVSVLSVFPDLYTTFLQTSLMRKAQEKGLVQFDVGSFLTYCEPTKEGGLKERLDAPIFGHGAGMLIKPTVVQRAIEAQEQTHGKAFKIFFSPQGQQLDQSLIKTIAQKSQEIGHLMLLPARYEGMDARVETHYADLIVSIGDFVLMGGDLPAMMLLEGVMRYLPGVVGKAESVEHDSFTGPFVDVPHYTEPVTWQGSEVPAVIRSGNHAAMEQWREQQAVKTTLNYHFDWLRSRNLTPEDVQKTLAQMPAHYVALAHADVLVDDGQLGGKRVGTTSVTSLDIHDVARSAATYGIKNYFLITPLKDQQKIVNHFLEFWMTQGPEYNKQRHGAIKQVRLHADLDEVIATIEAQEGKKPIIIATSAKVHEHKQTITYHDQGIIWQLDRPVLFLFGTGSGLSDHALERCDYLLVPLNGFSTFNHLSVRSAVAIILDRWLGISPKAIR